MAWTSRLVFAALAPLVACAGSDDDASGGVGTTDGGDGSETSLPQDGGSLGPDSTGGGEPDGDGTSGTASTSETTGGGTTAGEATSTGTASSTGDMTATGGGTTGSDSGSDSTGSSTGAMTGVNLFLNPSLETWTSAEEPNTTPDEWTNCSNAGLGVDAWRRGHNPGVLTATNRVTRTSAVAAACRGASQARRPAPPAPHRVRPNEA